MHEEPVRGPGDQQPDAVHPTVEGQLHVLGEEPDTDQDHQQPDPVVRPAGVRRQPGEEEREPAKTTKHDTGRRLPRVERPPELEDALDVLRLEFQGEHAQQHPETGKPVHERPRPGQPLPGLRNHAHTARVTEWLLTVNDVPMRVRRSSRPRTAPWPQWLQPRVAGPVSRPAARVRRRPARGFSPAG